MIAASAKQYRGTVLPRFSVLSGLGSVALFGASSGAVLGIAVGAAESLPWVIASSLISISFISWLLATIVFVAVGSWKFLSSLRGWGILLGLVAGVGILASLVRSASLYFAQIISGNQSLTWNVDYRYSLMHSQSLLENQGTDSLLIASGIPIRYHIGPAWVAASLFETLSVPIEFTSFALIPVISLIWLLIGLVSLFKTLEVRGTVAVTSLGLALSVPFLWDNSFQRLIGNWGQGSLIGGVIRENEGWYFGPNLMLNTFFALGILGASLALLLRSRHWLFSLIAGAGFGSILLVKPQYLAPALGIMLVLLLISLLDWKQRQREFRNLGLGFLSSILTIAGFSVAGASPWLDSSERSFSLIWRGEDMRGLEYLVGLTGVYLVVALLVGSAGVLKSFDDRRLRPHFRLEFFILLVALGSLFGVGVFRLIDVGLSSPVGFASSESNLLQGLTILFWLLLPLVMSWIAVVVRRGRLIFAFAATMLGVFGAALQVVQVAQTVSHPEKGYEAVDASDVREILASIDDPNPLLLISDIADPAEDYRREGDAWHVSATARTPFWFAGHLYELSTNREAQNRLVDAERFFGTQWSIWHRDFLMEKDITHVLISKRCPAPWFPELQGIAGGITESNLWFLVESSDLLALPTARDESVRPVLPSRPTFGLSPCLG